MFAGSNPAWRYHKMIVGFFRQKEGRGNAAAELYVLVFCVFSHFFSFVLKVALFNR